MYRTAVLCLISAATVSAFSPAIVPAMAGRRALSTSSMRKPMLGLRMQVEKPDSLAGQGLSDADRAAAQGIDSEAAWEAAQRAADQSGGIAVDFNPYDAETGYWLGEWICADCGYIYGSRGEQQPFETLGRWYKCPQCAGPRRRFAKKLGNKVGGASGDTAILISTLVGLVAIIGAFVFGLQISAF